MIKINLLPARKPKRQAEPGQRDVAIGVAALIAAGAVTFFALHKPAQDELAQLKEANAQHAADLKRRKAKIKDLDELTAAVELAQERTSAIDKLIAARAVPAHMLHELGEILTPGRMPTMTDDTAAKVKDPLRDTFRLREDWDPRKVWITSITESKGVFTIAGGAESEADVTQLAKRLQASVYFEEVAPASGQQQAAKDSGVTYYSFAITGKVVY